MALLTVEIIRVRWQSDDKDFTIAGVELFEEQPDEADVPNWLARERNTTIVGNLGPARAGDLLDVRGEWHTHPRFGKQLKVSMFTRTVATTDRSLMAWLRGFPEIGPQRARAIISTFGDPEAVCAVIEHDPARLTEIKGLTADRAMDIHKAFMRDTARRDSVLFLMSLDTVGESLASKVLDRWGRDTKTTLTEDPYALLELRNVGFATADAIATELGLNDTDPRRLAAAARWLLILATNNGHVYSTLDDLLGEEHARDRAKLNVTATQLAEGLELTARKHTAVEDDRYYLRKIWNAERELARLLSR